MRGILLDPQHWKAHAFCQELLARGILSKDTHGNVVRLSPPLTIGTAEIDHAVAAIADILHSRQRNKHGAGSVFEKID
jgi:ornithine--oxo-acid transaminase